LGCAPDQLIGALEVVVGVQGLVGLVSKWRLFVGVRAGWIQEFGRVVQHREKQGVFALGAQGVGGVEDRVAGAQQ